MFFLLLFLPQMPLEITRSFVENRDGTFDPYEVPRVENMSDAEHLRKQTPIRPFELKTYLRVGEYRFGRWKNE